MRTKLLLTGLAAALAACGSDNTTCGTGTTKMGGECVATGGSGTDTTCGTGTHLMGTMCVPDDNTVAAAPTISMMDPAESGITGGDLFTITGTGFNGSNVTDLHVFFGDTTNPDCEALLGAASATEVSGQVPQGCSLSPNITVTVTTNVGSATTPFHYDMIFAADGDAGGDLFDGGDFYVIDPFAGKWLDLGEITDADSNPYGWGGMDFNSTGTLFAATTGDSPADVDFASQLASIDISTGALTIIGDIQDADFLYNVVDIKFVGGTLYAWAFYDTTGSGDIAHVLISIDPATGAATQIGASTADSSFFGALAVDGSNNLLVAPSGAGSDDQSAVPTTGELDTVSPTDGTLTNLVTMDWGVGSPISAMTTYPGQTPLILGVIDNGTYGSINQMPIYNETLAIIDPAADTSMGNPIVGAMFDIPGQIGAQPHIDALAVPPVDLVLQRKLPRTGWKTMTKRAGAVSLRHR